MLTKRKLLNMIIDMKAIMNFQESDIRILERKVASLEDKTVKKTGKLVTEKTAPTKRGRGRPRKQA